MGIPNIDTPKNIKNIIPAILKNVVAAFKSLFIFLNLSFMEYFKIFMICWFVVFFYFTMSIFRLACIFGYKESDITLRLIVKETIPFLLSILKLLNPLFFAKQLYYPRPGEQKTKVCDK